MASETIGSFSSGRDPATMSAIATSMLSETRFSMPRNKDPFRSRKYKKRLQAIHLLPSTNEWFLMTKYRRFAAFSSSEGQSSTPPYDW